MKLGEVLAWLGRVQQSLRFKIIASVVVGALAVGGYVALLVAANAPGAGERIALRAAERATQTQSGIVLEKGPVRTLGMIVDSLMLTINPLEAPARPPADGSETPPAPQTDTTGALQVAGLFGLVAGAAAAIIWLGLGLSYLALFVLGWGLAWPLMVLPATAGLGQLLLAAAPLVLAFMTGMALLKLALGGPWPVMAVARNLLNEAVRMKVSLIFIVLLILLLSYVPGALNENQPLRYRIQQWMQYGIGLSYVVLAMLTLFLSAGTVAFEQRDKVIWQTMTKPVAPWQYLAGKWIGVMGLNAVLLAVTASGVFIFTEYLRHQPAQGELAYQVRNDGVPTLGRPDLMVEDRRLIDSQVLVARESRPMAQLFSEEMLLRAVEERIAQKQQEDQSVQDTGAERRKVRDELLSERGTQLRQAVEERVRDLQSRDPAFEEKARLRYDLMNEIMQAREGMYRTIPPGSAKAYFFSGLSGARSAGAPDNVTLRYRVNSGSNDPSRIYRLRFYLNGVMFERQVALSASQTLLFDKNIIDDEGSLIIEVQSSAENEREISFPPDGLEVLYAAGGYEANFFRIMLVLWVKLGFTAAVAIAASTFLSFPIACLVSMTVLFAAESAGFLKDSLEYYTSMTREGIDYFAVVVRVIAVPISRAFQIYSELKPTGNLIDGRLLGWSTFFGSSLVVFAWTLAALVIGWAIFRQRELATYSGR